MSIPVAAAIATLIYLCPPIGEMPGEDFDEQAQLAWWEGPGEPEQIGVPSTIGAWSKPMAWPVIGIHSVMLPTGKTLHYSYPSGTPGSKAMTWDPVTMQFTDVSMSLDIFCSGQVLLADGTVYVTGGNAPGCEFTGRLATNLFDPVTEQWTALGDMTDGRWYPTNVMLADGRILTFTGLNQFCETNPFVEMFTPGVGLSLVPEAQGTLPLFPRMHLLSDGRIALVGESNQTFAFELGVGWQFVDNSNLGWRSQGTSVLLPGEIDRIMIIGGENGAVGHTNTTEIIDLSDPNPQWQYAGSMNHARAHADSLILPDKTVLIIGGGTDGVYNSPVNVPELYDPATDTWTEMAPHVYGRMYHATTLLLPDARVLVTGQDSGQSQFWGEIYSPPYLFKGPQPLITGAPASVVHGQGFQVTTPDAASIASVVMVKPSSVTHSVNFQQRLCDLGFFMVAEAPTGLGADGTLQVTAPGSGTVAPPGYYMLFIVDGAGVPSRAWMVQVDLPVPGDANRDGIVNIVDLLQTLAAWGPCPDPINCLEDTNLDGLIDIQDLLNLLSNWS